MKTFLQIFFKIFILLIIPFAAQSQDFVKEYSINNLTTKFRSSTVSSTSNQEIVVVGDALEFPSTNNNDLIILQMSDTGKIIRSKILRLPGSDEIAYNIIPTKNGGYAIMGTTNKYDIADILILIIDANFSTISLRVYKQNDLLPFDRPNGIVQTPEEDFLISSRMSYGFTAVYDARPNFLKIAKNGQVLFSKKLNGYNTFYPTGLMQLKNSNGESIMAGSFRIGSEICCNSFNLQPILMKFDSLGNLIKAKALHGDITQDTYQNNGFYGLKEISDSSIVALGNCKTIPGQPAPQLLQSAFFLKIDKELNQIAFKIYASQSNDDQVSHTFNEIDGNLILQGANYPIGENPNIWYTRTDLNGNLDFGNEMQITRFVNPNALTYNTGASNFYAFKNPQTNSIRVLGTGFTKKNNSTGVLIATAMNQEVNSTDCFSNTNFTQSSAQMLESSVNVTLTSRVTTVTNLNGILDSVFIDDVTSCGVVASVFPAVFIDNIPPSIYEFDIKLNPASTYTTIDFETSKGNDYFTLQIYNVLGQKIATLIDNQLLTGKNSVRWDCANYSNGSYYVVLIRNGSIDTRKLLIMNNGR